MPTALHCLPPSATATPILLPDGTYHHFVRDFSHLRLFPAAGCDSIVTVDLTVNAISSTTEDVSICDGGSYLLPDGTASAPPVCM